MVRGFAAFFSLVLMAACAEGPVSYDVAASLPPLSTDSLQTISVLRARSMGFTTYEADSAVQRLQDLQIHVDVQDDFMFVDRRVKCGGLLMGLVCRQFDFLIVTFTKIGGQKVALVSAGTDQRWNPLQEWRLLKASPEIRAAADSMAGAFGTIQVLNGH